MSDLQFDTRVRSSGERKMIGQYEIIGALGAGGMGTVHLGRSPSGQVVAVKVIHPRLAVDEQFRKRFQREAALARRVAAFCTAPVLDFGEDDNGPYLVTEYVDGIPLSRAVSERGALAPSSVHGVAVGVAAALTAIHAAGLVHRDLKPGNVILSLSGPRVIDFGVARAADGSSDLTRTGMMVGSPGWMAPEQARGAQVTQAADIFGWGCLVAFAATGRHPFGDGDSETRAFQIMNEPPDLTGVPESLLPHVLRAVSKRPEERPTARALLSLLSGATEDLTELVRLPDINPKVPSTARPPARRWPLVVALLAIVGAVSLAAGGVYLNKLAGATKPPPSVPVVVTPASDSNPTPYREYPTATRTVSPTATPASPTPTPSATQAEATPEPTKEPSPPPPSPTPPTPGPTPTDGPVTAPVK